MAKATKKRNPQDSTTRNVRAANKKIAHLAFQVEVLVKAVNSLAARVKKLERAR